MTKTFSISCPRKSSQYVDDSPSTKFDFDYGNILKIKLEDGTLITVEVSEWGTVKVYEPQKGKEAQ